MAYTTYSAFSRGFHVTLFTHLKQIFVLSHLDFNSFNISTSVTNQLSLPEVQGVANFVGPIFL